VSEEKILRTLRTQAWQRAKGELQAVLETYWDASVHGKDAKFQKMKAAIESFVDEVEGEAWQE
jgi:hypothetical protein